MKKNGSGEDGMTLVEVTFAMLIMLAGLLTMAEVLAFSVVAGKTYGRDAGQTTAAARDKMEELMALQFTITETGASIVDAELTAGGEIYPAAAVDGYVDVLSNSGEQTSFDPEDGLNPTIAYVRQWKIEDEAAGTRKKISVSVRSVRSFDYGISPSTTLVSYKTQDRE